MAGQNKEYRTVGDSLAKYGIESGKSNNIKPAPEVPKGSYKNLDKKIEALKYNDHKLDFKLKSFIGPTVTWLMLAQVTVMNLAFWLYATLGFAKGTMPSDSVMIAFLTTSTAQIIGLALVVTRYLFPEKGVGWNRSGSS